jgi:HAD superfamily hydrolase (TIGR01509 family)
MRGTLEMGEVEAVCFDLDGTLVDTTYLHTIAWWRALDEAGEGRPMSHIHALIGMGGSELLGELLGRDDESISASHRSHFESMYPMIRALPGASDLLRAIAGQGMQVVIVTSARKRDLDALLGPLGCEDVIEEVVLGEEVDRAKPAPDGFSRALDCTGLPPETVIAVGDAEWDVKAARRAGIPCLGVESGGTDQRLLLDAGAVAVYADCARLLDALFIGKQAIGEQ